MIVINCVGVGHWGPNLVRIFATHPESRVGTVCDLSEERLALVQRNIPWALHWTRDPEATVTDPDAQAVVIATPVYTHYALAKAALEAGKHVLVEKPLCRSAAECEELVDLARRQGKVLAVGHVFLFNNAIRGVRNLIRAGDLGRIQYLFSTRTNLGPIRRDVNALWDLAAHDLSIFNYWLEADPIAVTARGQSYLNLDVEDVVIANFTYPRRVLASVHVSWLNPRKVREITVVGDHKMVVWNDMDLNEPVRIYNKSVNVEREPVYSDSFGSFRMQIRTGDVVIPHISGPEPLAAECAHFLDCIQGRAEPINSGLVGLRVVRALEAADQSMRERSAAIELHPVPGAEAEELGLPSLPSPANGFSAKAPALVN
jgi:predicted dehydrogenase